MCLLYIKYKISHLQSFFCFTFLVGRLRQTVKALNAFVVWQIYSTKAEFKAEGGETARLVQAPSVVLIN